MTKINPRFDGVHAFLDDFALPRPDRDGWRELAARGLIRISLGVESGDPEVRAIYHKNWDDDELRSDRRGQQSGGTRRERADAGRRRRRRTTPSRMLSARCG